MTHRERVIAVDPGETCGYALWEAVGDEADLVVAAQFPRQEFLRLVAPYLGDRTGGGTTTLVVERYTITPSTLRKSREPAALYTIGALEYLASINMADLVLQTPATAKGFATDDKLRQLGWYEASPGGHRNDAVRHLVTYLVAQRRMDPALLVT